MRTEQTPPFAVQIELVEGCNLYCNFCGLQGIRERPGNYKFMEMVVLRRITEELKRLKWIPRIELAMHGEPSLHPQRNEMVEHLRAALPQAYIMMTSNGGGFLKGGINEIFDAGLDTLALDNYEYVKIVPKILANLTLDASIRVICYPKEKDGNPHARVRAFKRLVIIEDISKAESGTHSSLNSHCGAAFERQPLMEPCAKPFREMAIRWDGSVAICCNDWRGELPVGKLRENALDEIWNGELFEAARRRLIRGKRDFNPCNKCDARSYRVGLLPDQKGNEVMPQTSDADLKLLNQPRGFLTLPVLRSWEKTNDSKDD